MGYTAAGREELPGLYTISIQEWEGEYNSIGSDQVGLEVSTYSFDQGEKNKRNLQ